MNDTRRQNRVIVTRLFQGFVKDYGEAAGKKIIEHLVSHAGGQRIRVPTNNPGLNQHASLSNDPLHGCSACFRRLWMTTCQELGQASGRAIMHKIVCELGGRRIWFPDIETLYRMERNLKICAIYNGTNHKEIALRFKLSVTQINNIIEQG